MTSKITSLDWGELAWEHGYKGDDRQMLKVLYEVTPINTLAQMFRMSSTTIYKRMDELGLARRPSGITIRTMRKN